MLIKIPPQDRDFFIRRFGLRDGEHRTLEELARFYEVPLTHIESRTHRVEASWQTIRMSGEWVQCPSRSDFPTQPPRARLRDMPMRDDRDIPWSAAALLQ